MQGDLENDEKKSSLHHSHDVLVSITVQSLIKTIESVKVIQSVFSSMFATYATHANVHYARLGPFHPLSGS